MAYEIANIKKSLQQMEPKEVAAVTVVGVVLSGVGAMFLSSVLKQEAPALPVVAVGTVVYVVGYVIGESRPAGGWPQLAG